MKNLLLLLSVLFTVGTALAPGAPRPALAKAQGPAGAAPRVMAIETYLTDIAQNVAGSRLKVSALLPEGSDPHSYEPTPADVVKIAGANVIIVNGAGVEAFLARLLETAGGVHKVIDASAGLKSRTLREAETAEMSQEDMADSLCSGGKGERPQPLQAGQDAGSAVKVPEESGFYEVALKKLADGSFGGALRYTTDERGDFGIAAGQGRIEVLKAGSDIRLDMEKTLPLKCGGLAQGAVVELDAGECLITFSGFKTQKSPLRIGPLGGHHHQGDPHFWLDPLHVVRYVQNIERGLSEADPEGAKIYEENAKAYVLRLKELDQWISEEVKQVPADRRLLVTNHESFGYFADRYGFKIAGSIIPSVSTDAAPSARQLAALIDRVKALKVKAIFLETGTNPQLARQVADETGIKVVTGLYTHSVTGPGGPAPSYIEMMKYDAKTIADALK